MLLMHLLQCSCRHMHLVPTLVAHLMVVKTTQLLLMLVLRNNVSAKLVCHKRPRSKNKIKWIYTCGVWGLPNVIRVEVHLPLMICEHVFACAKKQSPSRSVPSETVVSHQYCKLIIDNNHLGFSIIWMFKWNNKIHITKYIQC